MLECRTALDCPFYGCTKGVHALLERGPEPDPDSGSPTYCISNPGTGTVVESPQDSKTGDYIPSVCCCYPYLTSQLRRFLRDQSIFQLLLVTILLWLPVASEGSVECSTGLGHKGIFFLVLVNRGLDGFRMSPPGCEITLSGGPGFVVGDIVGTMSFRRLVFT